MTTPLSSAAHGRDNALRTSDPHEGRLGLDTLDLFLIQCRSSL